MIEVAGRRHQCTTITEHCACGISAPSWGPIRLCYLVGICSTDYGELDVVIPADRGPRFVVAMVISLSPWA